MELFINESIENGIKCYKEYQRFKTFDKKHLFEFYVIQIFVMLYGNIDILNSYELKNENSFINNLTRYGLSKKEARRCVELLGDYSKWLNSKNSIKTSIIEEIKIIMVNMVILKGINSSISDNDYDYFNKFFMNELYGLDSIVNIVSDNPNSSIKYWKNKKAFLDGTTIKFQKIAPELLDEKSYEEYGLDVQKIKGLSNQSISQLNDKILIEDEKYKKKKNKFVLPLKVVITSGNGFVDTLVLLSVMATEIMIGLLIAFSFSK